jgi:hypothetical protein
VKLGEVEGGGDPQERLKRLREQMAAKSAATPADPPANPGINSPHGD